jgi:hypothetical protein
MDLGTLISKCAARMRNNWILIVPPILIQVIVPLAFLTIASFTFFPLLIAFGLTADIESLTPIIVGGVFLLMGIFLVDTFLTAGWVYMNKRAVVDGRTEFADLWVGSKKYFLRILGGRLLVAMVFVLPVAVGTAVAVASILTLNLGEMIALGELTAATIFSLLAPIVFTLLGIVFVVALIELVFYIFLVPWMQALVVDDLGIMQSIKSSFVFVRSNLATIIGYMAISGIAWLLASLATSFVWPSISYSELGNPAIYTDSGRLLELMLRASNVAYSMISALLSAFFTLLLFFIYADRAHGLQTFAGPSGVPVVSVPKSLKPPASHKPPRGIKNCVNCGAQLVMLAVFCPHCGARQPPLPPQ